MAQIIQFNNFSEFIDYNEKEIHAHFFVNFYLTRTIETIKKGAIGVYDSFTIIDTDGSYLMAVLVDDCYLLFCSKWNDAVLEALNTKIDLSKYKRFLFNGSKPFMLAFFAANNTAFHIVKDRIIYSCKEPSAGFKSSSGELEMADMEDLDTLAQMSYEYSQEEYDGKGRDYQHMRRIVAGGIANDNFFDWRDQRAICSIAQIIYTDEEPPFIGHLYTAKNKRNHSYAASILHGVTKGLLDAGNEECGLVSDASNPASNKVFIKVGYRPIAEYISLTKEMWAEEDID